MGKKRIISLKSFLSDCWNLEVYYRDDDIAHSTTREMSYLMYILHYNFLFDYVLFVHILVGMYTQGRPKVFWCLGQFFERRP